MDSVTSIANSIIHRYLSLLFKLFLSIALSSYFLLLLFCFLYAGRRPSWVSFHLFCINLIVLLTLDTMLVLYSIRPAGTSSRFHSGAGSPFGISSMLVYPSLDELLMLCIILMVRLHLDFVMLCLMLLHGFHLTLPLLHLQSPH